MSINIHVSDSQCVIYGGLCGGGAADVILSHWYDVIICVMW